jgi:hypothetical protein
MKTVLAFRLVPELFLTVCRSFLRSGVVEATAASRKLGHVRSIDHQMLR